MSKVDDTIDIIWNFLQGNVNVAFRLNRILSATDLRNNATTRTALKRCRERAIAQGMLLRLPCPANNHTYALTNDANMVYDSAMHLWLIADGVKRTEETHRSFMRRNAAHLPRGDREIVAIVDKFEESQRSQQELIHQLIGITVETRRETRRGLTK